MDKDSILQYSVGRFGIGALFMNRIDHEVGRINVDAIFNPPDLSFDVFCAF